MAEIGQFRNVVKSVVDAARFQGFDGEGSPIYDEAAPLPIVRFEGTVKLHGSCGSVCYDGQNIWAQSKNNIITPDKDNAGFAAFVEYNREYFTKLLYNLYGGEPVALFGEWAGRSIQKGVAISEIERSFFIFGLKVQDKGWYPLYFDLPEHPRVFKMDEFKTYEIDIDFNCPALSQNKIIEMVEDVENECPVAKHFGISGIGEGIVFEGFYEGQRFIFKAKGEKHSATKVKVLRQVDDAKIQLKQDVAQRVCPSWRLEQMYSETFDLINGGLPDIKKTGDFLRAVSQDILKEELDVLGGAGLTMKDIGGYVSKIAKIWFMERLDKDIIGRE